MSELTLLYVHGDQIGYGRMGVYIADELRRRDITIYDNDQKSAAQEIRGDNDGTSPTNAICWMSVPSHAYGRYDGQHKSILTMWESMRLPEAFRENLHEFDLIMVPSWQNEELFSKYHDNVQFVPLGVDPLNWHYHKPPDPGQTFNFLISGRGVRKGIDLAYEAFRTVFPLGKQTTGPAPRLIIKSLRGQGDYYAFDIEHVTGKLTGVEEVELYRSAHCYLQPSRGEGFGLQPLQAIATGIPTILTNAHGHESYAHLGIGIDAATVPTTPGSFMMGDAGDWWEPDFEQLCESMWDVYNNYEAHCTRAKESAAEVAAHWTWSNTADRFLEVMQPELDKPYSGTGEWFNTERLLYKIVTSEDHYSEAAGIQRYFKAGETYYDLADIKRIMFDGGILSRECLEEDDHGLLPRQVEQLPEYIAARSHCPTCHQELNTRPTYADKLYEQMTQ